MLELAGLFLLWCILVFIVRLDTLTASRIVGGIGLVLFVVWFVNTHIDKKKK